MMNRIAELKPEYSSPWVWEFYQKNTYQSHDTNDDKDSMEPGITDHQISRFRKLALDFGRPAPDLKELRKHPPNLVLSWPLDCSVLDKEQLVHALASDDAGRAIAVTFLLDGKKIIQINAPPYEKTYSTASVSPGIHTIRVQATVADGLESHMDARVIAGSGSTAGSCN
jgi:hypothetical protein